jgi:hypothetical protein
LRDVIPEKSLFRVDLLGIELKRYSFPVIVLITAVGYWKLREAVPAIVSTCCQ